MLSKSKEKKTTGNITILKMESNGSGQLALSKHYIDFGWHFKKFSYKGIGLENINKQWSLEAHDGSQKQTWLNSAVWRLVSVIAGNRWHTHTLQTSVIRVSEAGVGAGTTCSKTSYVTCRHLVKYQLRTSRQRPQNINSVMELHNLGGCNVLIRGSEAAQRQMCMKTWRVVAVSSAEGQSIRPPFQPLVKLSLLMLN